MHHDLAHQRLVRRDHRPELVRCDAAGLGERLRLAGQDPATRLGGRRDEHEECERIRRRIACVLPRRDERADEAALAVTEQADACRVDARLALEPLDGHVGVAREIDGGRGREDAGRLRGAAVVVAKDGDARAGERVGEHREGLVAHERLVAVLRARTRHEDHARHAAVDRKRRGARYGERAREHVPERMRDGHLARLVRERRHWLLRSAQRTGAEAGLHFEADGRAERGLLEGALEHGHLGERLLALLRRQADGGVGARGEDDGESSVGALDGDREVAHALDEDVHRAAPTVHAFADGEPHRQLLCADLERRAEDARVGDLGDDIDAPHREARRGARVLAALQVEEPHPAGHGGIALGERRFETRRGALRLERERERAAVCGDIARRLSLHTRGEAPDADGWARRRGAHHEEER